MNTILVVDDDEAIRRLIKLNLDDSYRVFDTGEPEHALALALEHKPDAILLDLRMPRYSGFELCQTLASFHATQLIPVVIVSGEAGARTKQLCRDLRAADYFEKPVDFDALRDRLTELLQKRQKERRAEVRVRLKVAVRLKGTNRSGGTFDVVTSTENVGSRSFLCACGVPIEDGSQIVVHLASGTDEHVGKATIVRSEWSETDYPRYGCLLIEKTGNWVLS
jgi:DNA-binding response OmpR family regulator